MELVGTSSTNIIMINGLRYTTKVMHAFIPHTYMTILNALHTVLRLVTEMSDFLGVLDVERRDCAIATAAAATAVAATTATATREQQQ